MACSTNRMSKRISTVRLGFISLCFAVLSTSGLAQTAGSQAGSGRPDRQMNGRTRAMNPEIMVYVGDYSALPADLRAQAQAEAHRIFRDAGIETVWLDCRTGVT
jgi:ABC-type Fe3+/spermidine/putrescine transport system ATPase subunit